MYYNIKTVLYSSSIALLIYTVNIGSALGQGIVMLDEGSSAENYDPAISDETYVDVPPVSSQGPEESADVAIVADVVAVANGEGFEIEDLAPEKEDISIPDLSSIQAEDMGALAVTTDIFSQMSDLEKETTLLNLELRREQVKNSINAIKQQRVIAKEQEEDKKLAKKNKQIEWEKSLEEKATKEAQKLKKLEIAFEKTRQESLLNSYKNQMLNENQKWVGNNALVYGKLEELKGEKKIILDDSKNKFIKIKDYADNVKKKVDAERKTYEGKIKDLALQLSKANLRISSLEAELRKMIAALDAAEKAKENPFAEGSDVDALMQKEKEENNKSLSEQYVIMEIRGQAGELIAKLINQDGTPFFVKESTALQSGHVIDKITSSYVRADRDGVKDFLYFQSGGVLTQEPVKSNIKAITTLDAVKPVRKFISSDSIPGISADMMVR